MSASGGKFTLILSRRRVRLDLLEVNSASSGKVSLFFIGLKSP